jgi:hypothetical protein
MKDDETQAIKNVNPGDYVYPNILLDVRSSRRE